MKAENRKTEKTYEIDMSHGPLFGKIIQFAVPLMLSGILQLLFHAADIIVVGRYAGKESLAAVGSTSSLINLLVNVFVGLSIGANVLVARYFGEKNHKDVEETVHTAILTAFAGGMLLVVVGNILAEPLLSLMGTPEDVLSKSALYMRIFFLGMPVTLVYNFGGAILRAVGDTKRPLYYLLLAGVVNVILNLIFVIVFSMDVAGVALATVLSQCISAFLIIRCLTRVDASYRLNLKNLRFVSSKLKMIIRIGLPAGLQGAVFSISNVLIQSSINSFGSVAMAGSTAASNIEGFIYTSMNAFYQTALSFTSQNYGAREYKRMGKILVICLGLVVLTGLVMGNGAVMAGEFLIGIYSSDPNVIRYGMQRLTIIGTLYFICGIMDVMVGALRGMGYSVMPMLVSLTGACALRVVWIYTVFAAFRSMEVLYLSYPVTWGVTAAAHVVCYLVVRRKQMKSMASVIHN